MLRRLLAGLSLWMGTQVLLPPVFIERCFVCSSLLGSLSGTSQVVIAAELSDIRDRGYLIVAVKTNRPPLGFIDERGELSGFEVDIAHQLAAELLGDENAVRFVPVSNIDRLNAVIEDRVDMAIAALTITEPRRRLVNFSDPYYLDGTAFVVQSSNAASLDISGIENLPQLPSTLPEATLPQSSVDIQGLQDLRFSQIALLNRSSSVAHVRYILPAANLIGVDSYAEGQSLLTNGQVDAFAGDASVLTGWQREQDQGTSYFLLPEIISVEPLAIALPKGVQYNDLQLAINQSIRRWYAEEWLQERAEDWSLPAGVLPSFSETDLETDPPEAADE
ncbi:MAG: transporter substrate-binding domain-containing protein [Phormidesmis sp.]